MNVNTGSEVIVFDKSGRRLTNLRASVHRWMTKNEYGSAVFEIAASDPKATERNLQYGNLILVRRERLPMWGGVIDTPREWGGKIITVTAYSAEYLLTYRSPREKGLILSHSAGANFRELVTLANSYESLNIVIGEIYGGGGAVEQKITQVAEGGMYDAVVEMAETAAAEWRLAPVYEKGQLYFRADWAKRLGRETGYTLREGVHFGGNDLILSEQGRIINEYIALGDGAKQDTTARYRQPVDETSRGDYRLRMGGERFDVTGEAALEEAAKGRLEYWRRPRLTATITLQDEGKAFDTVDIGNSVSVSTYSAGFAKAGGFGWTGNMRYSGWDYDDEENTVEASGEEISA